ncbi:MAG: hypothetical protein KGI50_05520 [Patescibacteria group bacterium]|nr:hypothetical protein [Patescibacteria group bacterium]
MPKGEDLDLLSKRLCKLWPNKEIPENMSLMQMVHKLAGTVKCSRGDAKIALEEWLK